ncbi:MAG: MFS transporter [Oscillospiraceae bacterium]|nr:MFS transporter [Oscillospiraceae bacterium]
MANGETATALNNAKWGARLVERITPESWLGSKMGDDARADFKRLLASPKRWLRGTDAPEGHVTPWELLIFFFSSMFNYVNGSFAGRQDFLFKEYYKIKPNDITKAGVISSLWDAFNDPILGAWMDRKRFGADVFRKILRISAVTGSIINILKMVDGGLSNTGHLVVLVLCNCSQDIIGTLASVADSKMRAGISPYTQQRTRTAIWASVGGQFGYALSTLPLILMSLRDVLGFNDYQIIFYGSVIWLPFSIAAPFIITFIRQRVDFNAYSGVQLPSSPEHAVPVGTVDRDETQLTPEEIAKNEVAERRAQYDAFEERLRGLVRENEEAVRALPRRERKAAREKYRAELRELRRQETGTEYRMDPETGEPKLGLMDTLSVVKHNRYFIANTAANFLTVFTPTADQLLIYRYMVPRMKMGGKRIGGEMMLVIHDSVVGIPVTILQPFARQIVNAMGGPLRTHQINSTVAMIAGVLRFLIGYNTFGKLALNFLIESIVMCFTALDGVASTMLNYEMLDYVELKTGVRSEGVTMSVNALFLKIVTNNIGMATGNAFLQWTGYRGGYVDADVPPPQRFMKYMWGINTLCAVVDSGIFIAARSFVHFTPEDRERVEAALIERRGGVISEISE